jgi:hypothetical protein
MTMARASQPAGKEQVRAAVSARYSSLAQAAQAGETIRWQKAEAKLTAEAEVALYRAHPADQTQGSVSADQIPSISVSKRSSMRTTPLPSADRRLPRMRAPGRALVVI